jgi:hypothetical protein
VLIPTLSTEPRIQQIGVYSGVRVDENSVCGEALRAVASYSVSVIEVPVNPSVELNLSPILEAGGNVIDSSSRQLLEFRFADQFGH